MSEIKQMQADYERGVSVTQLAITYRVPRETVRQCALRNGWTRPPAPEMTPTIRAAMKADYLRGCTSQCLAAKYSVHPAAVPHFAKAGSWDEAREAYAALPPSTSEILALDPVAFDTRITALLQAEQDLAALRERHAAQTAALAQVRDDYLADDARYLRQHREDADTIASLRSEVEAIRSGKTA